MDKPTKDEIQMAIEWFSNRNLSSVYMDSTCMVSFRKPAPFAVLHTIEYVMEQALERIQTEPCDYCKLWEGYDFCPNCGRKLKE